jgi:signal transduction histidine kinase
VRRVPIHTKLFAALAVPLIGLVAITVFEVAQSAAEARDIRNQADLAKSATGPDGLLTSLQDERNRATVDMIGQGALLELPVADNAAARQVVDQALANFRNLVADQQAEVQETYQPALDKLDELDAIRADVDANEGPFDLENIEPTDEIFQRYSEVVDALLQGNTRVAVAIDDPELRRGADLAYMAGRETDLIARLIRTLLLSGATNNNKLDSREELAAAGGLFGQVEKTHNAILDMSTGEYEDAGQKLSSEVEATGLIETVVPQAIESGDIDFPSVLGAVSVERDETYYGFRNSVKQILEEKADNLAAEADQRVRLFRIFALLAVIIATVATWAVSRSITRPLRALTRQATEMANHRLPDAVLDILDTPLGDDVTVPHVDAVKVQTRDEVADVADALNTVQDSALDLAVEQAVLRRNIADSFVNLGRRNQNLLGRQLDFITELEHNETDPDTLANLFRLDHLATRMRRNAESLLVLAGIDPPRKWAAPVRITDAIRAALGEVEDYQRVTVRAVEPATIMGSAAADLAHLLAELIENALIFSPPDQTVEIRGRAQPAGYTLAIIDSGLGMPPEELQRANRRLAGAESFTIAPSKYLGHYVAGNLAARHGVNVSLHNSPGHGITATINLPPALLTTEPTGLPGGGMTDTAPGAPQLRSSFSPGNRGGAPTGGGQAQPALPAVAATEALPVAHTASGLAKRAPRGGGAPEAPAQVPSGPGGPGNNQPGSTRPATPDDDLIRTLAQYTSQRNPVPPGGSQPPLAPAAHGAGPGPGAGSPVSPATGTPALTHLPPFPSSPPAGVSMRPAASLPPLQSRHQPAPGAPAPGGPGTPGFGGPGQPGPAETAENPVLGSAGGPGAPPLPTRRQSAGVGFGPSAGSPAAAGGTPATNSGLTRRVRGAQLPNTQPISLRRGTGSAAAAAAGAGAGAGAPGRPGQPDPHVAPPSGGLGGPFGRPTGGVPRVRTTGQTPALRTTGSTPAIRHTGSTPAIRNTGQTPAIRNTGQTPAVRPGGAPGGGAPAAVDDTWATQSSAKDVYSFLTDFTAGVQRGLDESGGEENSPE